MKTTTLVLIALFCTSSLFAQNGFTLQKDSLQSDILKQKRFLSIYLPEGYDAPDAKFPVIYVLDGDWECQNTLSTARFLNQNGKMPKAIVVGISNIDRDHDFLPVSTVPNQGVSPTAGGADHFIQFFKKELIPYIDKKFKTDHYNVLQGHSHGGMFTVYSFFNDPDLFDAYIALEPTLYINKDMIAGNARDEFLKPKNWKKHLFIAGREGYAFKVFSIPSIEKQLSKYAPKELNWKIIAYGSDETHGSMTFKSLYDGLCFIFDTGNNFSVLPNEGLLPKGASTDVLIQSDNSNARLHYTLDGTEPGEHSPLCQKKTWMKNPIGKKFPLYCIKIAEPCTLKIKNVTEKYNGTSQTVTRVFTEGKYMNGQQSVENLKPGLKYSYYEGVWDSLPDFSKLTPVKTGITDLVDYNMALKNDGFAIQYEGYIHITKKDLYKLWLESDDGSKLYLNNQLQLNNDGIHGFSTKVKNVPLKSGYYSIKIQYFQRNGGKDLGFACPKGNEIPRGPIQKGMLFYQEGQ